jgi:hypothetical protein
MLSSFRQIGFALPLFAFILTGCGGDKLVKVHGKLLKNGSAMAVSEDTYVTLSFVAESKKADQSDAKSYSAKFDQKTGTYTVELPAGSYKTMVAVALPAKKDGKLNAPSKPVKSDKVHELTKDQELDIEVP